MWLNLNKLLPAVLIGLVLIPTALAQDRVSLVKKIKETTETHEAQWKLVRLSETDDPGKVGLPETVWFQWEFDKKRVDANIFLFSEANEATSWMKYFRSKTAYQTTQLAQMGEQNFVEHYPDDTVFIVFQRGRMLLFVDATNKDVAVRFALLIHSQLSAT